MSTEHRRRETNLDPLRLFGRALSKLNTEWLRATYPFASFGRRVSIAPTCDIWRGGAKYISVGEEVYLASGVWLNIVGDEGPAQVKLVLGNGCRIGRRSTISARSYVELEPDVLLAPNVFIVDHNHEFSDPRLPIHEQGVNAGGRVVIGRNSWLGYGAVICCTKGELTIGRNSVVGANSVVTRSFPDYSVIAGNPAKLIRTYDPVSEQWIRVKEALPVGSR